MRNGTDRDAPKLIEPPTGPLEIYAYDPKSGRATLVEACGEDIARGEKVLRRLDGPACRARGGVVIGVKYGTAPTLIGPMKAAVMVAHVAAKTASPRKTEPVKARVAVERLEIEVVEDESPTAPTNTDVEPAAPSTTTDHEEPMTTDETPCCDAHECEDPRAGVRADTKPELAGFCRHHRKVAVDRVRDHGISFAEVAAALREGRSVEAASSKPARKAPAAKPSKPLQSAKKPARKPAKAAPSPAADDPMAPLREALDALVSGGVDEARVREIVREELRALLVRPS